MKTQSEFLAEVIQESETVITSRAILKQLERTGNVSIEEASIISNLVKDVLYEAAEEFLPDEADEGAPTTEITGDLVLKDDTGNTYIFHSDTGTLELQEPAESPVAPMNLPDVDAPTETSGEVPMEPEAPMMESASIASTLLRIV